MTRPVLIVEDDPDIAEGLRYNLEREGLDARVALTGEQGLALALDQKSPPALVILDLMLPGMSGTELCRRLRREPSTRRTPSSCSRRAPPGRARRRPRPRRDDYISKPSRCGADGQSARRVAPRRRVGRGALRGRAPLDRLRDMRVACDGEAVRLTRKEFSCWRAGARGRRVATRQQLLDNVWVEPTATRARSTCTSAASGRNSAPAATHRDGRRRRLPLRRLRGEGRRGCWGEFDFRDLAG